MEAVGSVLTNKYSEGYPGKRYYGGNQFVDEVEDLARDRVKALFGADARQRAAALGRQRQHRRLPGAARAGRHGAGHEPRPRRPPHPRLAGEHLRAASTTSSSYGVTPSDERIDYDQVRDLALEHRPKMIVAGATAYPRDHRPRADPRRSPTRSARCSCSTPPTSPGSIAGGAHPNPVPFADVVTFTTHKTLRGPRGGCILSRPSTPRPSTRRSSPACRAGRSST